MQATRPTTRHTMTIRLVWLVFALMVGLYCAWRFSGATPLETNLLALLPPSEHDPLEDQAVDKLAVALGDRAVFLVSSHNAAEAEAAARQLGTALSASGAFRSVIATLPPFDPTQIVRFYLPYRFGLLDPTDRAALANGTVPLQAMLQRHMYAPPQFGLVAPLADDPWGWFSDWLSQLPISTTHLQIENNMLVAHHGATTDVMVVASLPGSAYESAVQTSVEAASMHADASVRKAFPGITTAKTGAVFYAESARRASEKEVQLIGTVSLCGVALLILWAFRSPKLLLLGFVSTALGILSALAATLLVFGKLHLLTLVFGASLIGEAVDYSIQYFVTYLAHQGDWRPWREARAVKPALAVALTTSLLGYAILAWVPFPALKQIACFAIVGICIAFASVLSLLPALLTRAPVHRPQRLFDSAAALLQRWHRWLSGRRAWYVSLLLLLAAVPGWCRLSSDDDIHLLIERDPALVAQESTIRTALGIDDTAQFFLVRGATPEQVLQNSEALTAKLEIFADTHPAFRWQSITGFVPSVQRQRNDRALLEQRIFTDRQGLHRILAGVGFRPAVADAWMQDFAKSESRLLTVHAWLDAPWSVPFRQLWLGLAMPPATGYAAVVIPQSLASRDIPALLSATDGTPGVSLIDKAADVSRLFHAYRRDSALWLIAALVLVGLLLAWRYRPRAGILVVMPVALAIGITLGLLGYAHLQLNLFNWLGLMLVLCVGVNYAVFLREGSVRRDANLGAVWTGVLLSAATTLLSFGLLGISTMPALRSFGITLALGIAGSALLAPMGMPTRREDPA